jgi:micrococcal nuclease
VKVCAKVEGTHKSSGKSQLIFLNLGKPYPNAPLLAVIFEKDFKNFGYAPEKFLDKKNVCITGKLVLYKGKPEFIIKDENQIQIE